MIFRLLLEYLSSTELYTLFCGMLLDRVTTCLENLEILEMSGNYTDFREMSGISLKVMEMSGNCQGKKILSWKIVAVDGTSFYDVIIMNSLSLNMNLTVWSLTLTLVVHAWYEYQLKWSWVPRIVREMSGNFVVSGEWSPWLESGTGPSKIYCIDHSGLKLALILNQVSPVPPLIIIVWRPYD